MKYGLLTYKETKRSFNIGDNIQSLAAKQFLPQVDVFLNREELALYRGPKVKLIMNGWFTHNAKNWIPSDDITPLFVSFHVNTAAAPYMLDEKGINYLKKHAPIGCRDIFTLELLQSKGIDSYFSGCLTLTLDKYKANDQERNDDIFIVDPLYSYPSKEKVFYDYKSFIRSIGNGDIFKMGKRKEHLKNLIDEELFKTAKYVNQTPPSKSYSEEEKLTMAEDILRKYSKAKLVVTSRIHCGLPSLALETPAIYINGFSTFADSCRMNGISDLFNKVDINSNTGEFTTNFPLSGKINKDTVVKNSDKYLELAEKLKEKCHSFIND